VGVGAGFRAGSASRFEPGFDVDFALVAALGFAASVPGAGVFGLNRHRSDTGQRQHSGFSALHT